MSSLEDRALAVLCAGWRLLPSIKHEAPIAGIRLADLGAQHGNFNIDSNIITLGIRLFRGDRPEQLPLYDIDGNEPPQKEPYVSRALATWCHEAAHAIGYATGLDSSKEWLTLNGFVEASDDPEGTGRYWERRNGWENGPSAWRYPLGQWWPRDYSTSSPQECFADCVAHVALGWFSDVVHPSGIDKMNYILRHVWCETGIRAMAASAQRWQKRVSIHAQ